MIDRSYGSILSLTAWLCLGIGAAAQPADPTAEAETEAGPPKSAMLRGWIFPSGQSEPVSLGAAVAGAEEKKSLASSKDGAIASAPGYQAGAAGATMIELKSGDRVLASKSGSLRPGRHYTALAWNNGGSWELQVFSDDLASPNASDRPLRVLNFAQGRDTTIALDNGAENPVAKDSVQEMKLPGKVTLVTARVKSLNGGPPAQSSVEIDFASSPSAYVVIGPDYRGRMRPRVITGGTIPEPVDGAAGGAP